MELKKGIKRRTIVYFSITTLILVFYAISLTVNLPVGLNHLDWRNAAGNVAVGEDFQFPEHPMFKATNAMRIVSYVLTLLLVLCFVFVLIFTIKGFRNGLYFSRLQVALLRWSALFGFLLFVSNELCAKFHMLAIGNLYGKTSDIKLATTFQVEIQEFVIPLLLLIFAEIINIALRLNEEEAMTI